MLVVAIHASGGRAVPSGRYTTESGSVYEIDGNKVRRIERSVESLSERVSIKWREAQSITFGGIGTSIDIVWGNGVDEYSPEMSPDLAAINTRKTVTTPIVSVEAL